MQSMIPKSCRLFGQDHGTEQMLRAKSRFNLKRFRRTPGTTRMAAILIREDQAGACQKVRTNAKELRATMVKSQASATQAHPPPWNSSQLPESRKLKPPKMKAKTAIMKTCIVFTIAGLKGRIRTVSDNNPLKSAHRQARSVQARPVRHFADCLELLPA
jgi:hypothetical protein